MPAAAHRLILPAFRGNGSFVAKMFVTAALVALGDQVFGSGDLGAAAAALAAAWLLGLWIMRPVTRSSAGAMAATVFAWALVPVFVEDPSPLAIAMFWASICLAALLPKAARFDDAWRWAGRLALHFPRLVAGLTSDAQRLRKTYPRWTLRLEAGRAAAVLALPLAGGAVFVSLFASANPIVADWLHAGSSRFSLPPVHAAQAALWVALAAAVWSTLRPYRPSSRLASGSQPRAAARLPGVSEASVTLSLVLFNAIFAVENALDIAFLWSGAPLPEGVTLADYAHRGAYPLIVTSLLAGAFVLVACRPRSPLAASRALRPLVLLWIGQNVFLVASSALRTIDYVEAYSLTRLRLAALIWMGLVAVGLGLICWRILRDRSGPWLINANAIALLATLSLCTLVDLGSVAATWNVRHNELVGGGESDLDVRYLELLGPSALDAMIEFERNNPGASLTLAVASARRRVAAQLAVAQSDWRTWTFRGARRLAAAQAAELNSGEASTESPLRE